MTFIYSGTEQLFDNGPVLKKSLVVLLTLIVVCFGQYPVRDTELGDTTVQWDHYSMLYRGERLWSFSGEFHPFRLPAPELWEDILTKMKAMGLNTMSFYAHWGMHASSNTTLDFETGARNLDHLYELCTKLGLFVNARPGPYINAELSAGGMALWATTGAYGDLRNEDSRYMQAWEPYMTEFAKITAKHQVTRNGTVIMYQLENEYPEQWSNAEAKVPRAGPIAYMKDLFKNAQENGIVVPLTHNMPSQSGKSWSVDYDTVGAGGNVHIYGLDNYPTCWSCNTANCGGNNPSFALANYVDHFQQVSPNQPSTMPEFQGGVVNSWDGPPGGCEDRWSASHANFYYRDVIAQRVTVLNLYMAYGGTNWGWIGVPFNPTSYGYAAAISENRFLSDKFYEIKNLALFTRSAKELTKTRMTTRGTAHTDNSAITTTELRNVESNAGFHVIRHTDPESVEPEQFRMSLQTSAGNYTVPTQGGALSLVGNKAKIITTDFNLGDKKLIYSTLEIITWGIFDGQPTVVMWIPDGEDGEFLVKDAKSCAVGTGAKDRLKMVPSQAGLTLNLSAHSGKTILTCDNGVRAVVLGKSVGDRFWAPPLTNDPMIPLDQVAFVIGGYLIRNVELQADSVSISGDSTEVSEIEVFTAEKASKVKWNGNELPTTRTEYGSLIAKINGPGQFTLPPFAKWKVKDSIPEKEPSYDDTGIAWINADWMETPSKHKDATKPYLYADQYGFHNGILHWRGRFDGQARGARITVQGGVAHGWSAWLNGKHVASHLGKLDSPLGTLDLLFGNDTVKDTENILLIMQDNSGHDQIGGATDPRGIINATLFENATGFKSWKLAGTAGGAKQIDTMRTQYNEGGLTAERLGWHLPGFNDRDWDTSSPAEGFEGAGVKFYRTTLDINTPVGHDVGLSVNLNLTNPDSTKSFRAYLYINGWQYGKFFPSISEFQNNFKVPPGIWNYNGNNLIGVALWNMAESRASVKIEAKIDWIASSSFNSKFDSEYLRPSWTESREQYI